MQAPCSMRESFCKRTVFDKLKGNSEFLLPRVRTVSYGAETIKSRGHRRSLILPHCMRNTHFVSEFKMPVY